MKIKTKGELLEAYVEKKRQIDVLEVEVLKAKQQLQMLNDAICIDEDLMAQIQEGGAHTVQNKLVAWDDTFEQLEVRKVFHSWDEKSPLNADQIKYVGGEHE